MIKRISIRNFALIKDLTLLPDKGLNVILGETGSGKSIILDALAIALGEKASPDLIYPGENKCIIEIEFECGEYVSEQLKSIDEFEENGNVVIITKEFNRAGNTRSFINDSPALASKVRRAASFLVDFHSQNDHHLLPEKSRQMDLLDGLARNGALLKEYRMLFEDQKHMLKKMEEIGLALREAKEKSELNTFIIEEISALDPQPGEDEKLDEKIRQLENSEETIGRISLLSSLIEGPEFSAGSLLAELKRILASLSKTEERYEEFSREIAAMIGTFNDLAAFNGSYLDKLQFDAEEIERLRTRYSKISVLKRKYGTIDEMLAKKENLSAGLEAIGRYEGEIGALELQLRENRKAAGAALKLLNAGREKAFEELREKIPAILAPLGFKYCRMELSRTEIPAGASSASAIIDGKEVPVNSGGNYSCELLVSTNKGMEPGPLGSVLSGGEMSRLLLGLKSVVAEAEPVPTLIFDEIDAGVSGAVARNVGLAIRKLARDHQVICITHSAQIASLAQSYYSVTKTEEKERTVSTVSRIDEEEFIMEIARLLSPGEVSENSLNLARELTSFR